MSQPIDMILHCPKCGKQHIDEPESERAYTGRLFESAWWELGGEKPVRWMNPPHKSHLCRKEEGGCGTVWRPADVPTNGVQAIKTRGEADTWPDGVPEAQMPLGCERNGGAAKDCPSYPRCGCSDGVARLDESKENERG